MRGTIALKVQRCRCRCFYASLPESWLIIAVIILSSRQIEATDVTPWKKESQRKPPRERVSTSAEGSRARMRA